MAVGTSLETIILKFKDRELVQEFIPKEDEILNVCYPN